MSEALLEVRDLVKDFAPAQGLWRRRRVPPVRAVDGVSLAVRRGETLGVVGESGCGKTTLARLMLRLIDPTSGTVRVDGRDVTHLRGRELRALRRELQMVFQDPSASLNQRRTVGAIIAEPFAIHGLERDRAARRRAVQELMERVGLDPEHHNRYPHAFSSGQRQRIGIARALALEPKLLVADEPVSALDASIQAQILNLLDELRRELGLTLVLIAHDLAVVRHLCERVAVMQDGRVVEVAEVADLYVRPQHAHTRALLAAAPRWRAQAPGSSSPDSSSSGS